MRTRALPWRRAMPFSLCRGVVRHRQFCTKLKGAPTPNWSEWKIEVIKILLQILPVHMKCFKRLERQMIVGCI